MKRGFSLIELSIVLVILGLLTGGILAGKSLIRASEIRSVSTDFQRFTTATFSFRDKYFALPGDVTNAVSFWGSQAGSTSDNYTITCGNAVSASSTSATCNGNGDGRIGNMTGGSTVNNLRYEAFRYWQHLANAGLIEGQYTGVQAAGTSVSTSGRFDVIANVNSPASRLPDGVFTIGFADYATDTGDNFAVASSNLITIAGRIYGGNGIGSGPFGGIFSPAEAWNVDNKMDDGMPGLGRIMSTPLSNARAPDCTDSDDHAVAVYQLDRDTKDCLLKYKIK